MSALTPIIRDFETFSLELLAYVNGSIDDLEIVTRSTMRSWQKQAEKEILEHDMGKSDNQWLHAITSWLGDCTGKAFDKFSRSELVNAFLEIQLSLKYGESLSAQRKLALLQKEVEMRNAMLNFAEHIHQNHQHNHLEDLETAMEDMSFDELGLDEPDIEDGTTDDLMVFPISHQESLNSPPRKRQRVHSITTQAKSDYLPLTVRSKSRWNAHLQANPNIWVDRCREWKKMLDLAYQDRDGSLTCNQNIDLSDDDAKAHRDNVVATLRELRAVRVGIFKKENWREAVKGSGLSSIICSWSDPKGLVCWRAKFVKLLIRKHRILETLLVVLESWIPSSSKQSWLNLKKTLTYTSSSQNDIRDPGRHLFKALRDHPHVIPREAYPASVFFLLSYDNFQEAVVQWLGFGLENAGVNTKFLNSELQTRKAYDDLMKRLHSFKDEEFSHIKDSALELIYRRSVQFRNLMDKPKENFLKDRASLNSPCQICKHLPEDKRCIQKVPVTVQKLDDSWIGCGVSYSARDKIDAIPIKNSEAGDFEERPVVHPINDLKLKVIQCPEEILQRCSSMTYYFFDEKNPDRILDFWTYNAFSEPVLEQLNCHHQALQTIKSIDRGKQFDTYTQGHMVAKGSRAPKGGSPGDAYTMYSGMGAVDEKSINALFDDAEDSMILVEAARVIHPPSYKNLELEITDGDKLGTSGATAYLCKNYASPLHRDDDACPGLCAQYRLQAKRKGHEYGFIFADYGLSFDSSMTHGTILPCIDPLETTDITIGQLGQRGDPGDDGLPPFRISSGAHVTKTKRNVAAAQKYRVARILQEDIQSYWES
ncbi:hypothetical protein CVT26_004823 [Gymnopilus dilepis]|uniref:Uncharacterized protein n=1 Tax=Gymnopilus dilepis TaxID=231916 RepID=A0A409XZI0_9AGAR|nr:hypothetical protein CVT26_004823 [Gymnopilus dilepis]